MINFQRQNPAAPVIVALTGTDLYRDIQRNHRVQESLDIATRIVVLQPKAIEDLQPSLRDKTRVIYQPVEFREVGSNGRSANPRVSKAEARSSRHFDVCVIGHLRAVKDPFRTAVAARLLPASSKIRILQVGAAPLPKQWRPELAGKGD